MCGKWSRALVVLIALGVVGAAAYQAPSASAWVPATQQDPPPPPPDPDPLPDPGPVDPPVDPPTQNPCHQPEPSTMVLAGLGAAALAAGAYRRRRNAA